MITADNLKELLRALRFEENNHIFTKHFPTGDFELKVDFKEKQLAYYPKRTFLYPCKGIFKNIEKCKHLIFSDLYVW